MVFLWFFMVFLWCFMVFLWCFMVFLCFFMVFLCFFMVFLCFFMVFLWCFMVFLWCFMVFLCFFMVFLCFFMVFLCFFMVFLWFFMVFLWFFFTSQLPNIPFFPHHKPLPRCHRSTSSSTAARSSSFGTTASSEKAQRRGAGWVAMATRNFQIFGCFFGVFVGFYHISQPCYGVWANFFWLSHFPSFWLPPCRTPRSPRQAPRRPVWQRPVGGSLLWMVLVARHSSYRHSYKQKRNIFF